LYQENLANLLQKLFYNANWRPVENWRDIWIFTAAEEQKIELFEGFVWKRRLEGEKIFASEDGQM
jgi:hypothetical protein